MNTYQDQLIELSQIDKAIDNFEPQIDQIKSVLNKELGKEQELVKKLEQLQENLSENELTRRKNEAHLAELSEKLKTLSAKSGSIKTEKEMKALQLEEEITKEQIDFANEEIERLDKTKGFMSSESEELRGSIEAMQDDITKVRTDIEQELQDMDKKRMKVFENKQKLVSKMNQNIIVFYEKIRRWAKNTTVVPVKKQACYGCYMKLNDNIYSSVLQAKEIITCPHCGRILYKEKVIEEEVETTS